MSPFDYRTAGTSEILDLAGELRGLVLGQIPGGRFDALESKRGKGEAGAAIEAYFGIPPNSRPEADFPGAEIELKAVPVVKKQDGFRVKERTVVSMIDYSALASETWETAHVRSKLHILFVFFEHLQDRPKQEFPVLHVTLWQPEAQVLDQIHTDWMAVHGKVLAGLAHELSEGDGRILGPCTKAMDSTKLRRQPFSDILAKSRAFALKPMFTFALYLDSLDRRVNSEQLAELSNLERLRHAFRRFEGRSIEEVGRELVVAPSVGKSYAASVVRRAVVAASPIEKKELERTLTIKMSRVAPDLHPYEALSFPAFSHHELADEDWEDSDLLSRIEHMLIVPVRGARKETPQAECLIGSPVYWEPTAGQLARVEQEWSTFRDLIREGHADSLPKESTTQAIHVRPHGRDATDRDPTPGGGDQTKKSFWLNKRFVQQILQGTP
jgi:DNA mismatch repair protein MutH